MRCRHHGKSAAIDQLIRFDSHDEMLKYIIKLKSSRKENQYEAMTDTTIRVRIQYNNNVLLVERKRSDDECDSFKEEDR